VNFFTKVRTCPRAVSFIVLLLKVPVKENKTKDRFIGLRAHGLPLAKIAAEIGASNATLVNWERELKEGIDNLRSVEFEALYDKYYLSTRKKVEFLERYPPAYRVNLKRDLSDF